jgi:two-component system, cell cycle response regulator
MADKQNALILIIVADPSTRRALQEMLEGTDFILQFAESEAAGMQKAEELLPAAIVLDIEKQAPTSGYETCRRLRANRLLSGIPVLLLCEREDRDSRAAGLSAGANDFLEKPPDGLELLARLHTLTRLSLTGRLLSDLTRFSWMVEHAHEGYLMLDEAGAIHYANERALNLLNLPDDFIGLPFRNVVERQYVPQPAETWEHWPEDPAPCFLVQPEGPTARAVWVILEGLDTPLGVEYQRIVRMRDETERMAIYQDMRKFHTAIRHKLRTPMSMLYTSMSLIKSQIASMTAEEVKSMMERAIKGTDRLAEEVRSILTYIEAPMSLNVGEPVRLEKLPEMVTSICADLHLEHVSVSLPADLYATVIALTPDALEMILQELLENSHKFHPMHTPKIEISAGKTEEGYISMRFADDGMNLSIEQLEWAWLPYFQGEKNFTGEIPGMGLGFPLVATLVWKAGGDLRLRNRSDGPGVIVDLKIPLESTMRQMERSAKPYGQ